MTIPATLLTPETEAKVQEPTNNQHTMAEVRTERYTDSFKASLSMPCQAM